MRRFLLPAVLGLVAAGIAVMALSGLLDVDRENTFIQGEMDGTRIDVAAKFSARVAATPGRDGAPVRQGDLLLRLDGTEMEARVLQTRQELERAPGPVGKSAQRDARRRDTPSAPAASGSCGGRWPWRKRPTPAAVSCMRSRPSPPSAMMKRSMP